MSQWYIGSKGTQAGPFSAEQVRMMLKSGIFKDTDLAWREGMVEWAPLGAVSLSTPPPPGVSIGADQLMAYASAMVGARPDESADRGVRLLARLVDWVISTAFIGPGMVIGVLTRIDWSKLPQPPVDGRPLPREAMRNIDWAELVPNPNPVGIFLLFLGILFWMGLQTWFLTRDGQSMGKKVCHLRIVRAGDGGNPGFLRAVLVRSVLPYLLAWIPCLGSLFALANPLFIFGAQRRCLHDLMAGTRVVWSHGSKR
jgi:uncharacterized RDD family membrane protein YckC